MSIFMEKNIVVLVVKNVVPQKMNDIQTVARENLHICYTSVFRIYNMQGLKLHSPKIALPYSYAVYKPLFYSHGVKVHHNYYY